MTTIKCPICGNTEGLEEEYDVCHKCGWEIDYIQQKDPDLAGGANHMSVNQAREAYAKGEPVR